MVLTGATFWGLSGTAAQVLFATYGMSPGQLVSVRLLLAGVLFLLIEVGRGNASGVVALWRDKADIVSIFVFGLFGMLGVQLTYFLAIWHGNAATATLLQYLGPIIIILYTSVRYGKKPTRQEITATGLATLGTYLLITDGSFSTMAVSLSGVLWGLGSAIALAFYTMFPRALLHKHGSSIVTGWSMCIGGTVPSAYYRPWEHLNVFESVRVDLLTGFVILVGTFLAFFLYLDSLRLISAAQASLLGCAEPLSASLVALIWLHVRMGVWGGLGALCIVGGVIVLSVNKTRFRKRR